MHISYLRSVYDLVGKDVVDVGAGDGSMLGQLDQSGAVVTGIEIDPAKVESVRNDLSGSISMQVGRAENLPLDDRSMDLACFFFSFHHVPIDAQEKALLEVKRILRPAGRLHVVEPFPHGSMFEVVRMIEDETEVRIRSHCLLNALGDGTDYNLIARKDYILTREYPDFAFFADRIVKSDPGRSAIFPSVRKEMEETFDRVVRNHDGKRVLHQPCAAYHFEIRP